MCTLKSLGVCVRVCVDENSYPSHPAVLSHGHRTTTAACISLMSRSKGFQYPQGHVVYVQEN